MKGKVNLVMVSFFYTIWKDKKNANAAYDLFVSEDMKDTAKFSGCLKKLEVHSHFSAQLYCSRSSNLLFLCKREKSKQVPRRILPSWALRVKRVSMRRSGWCLR